MKMKFLRVGLITFTFAVLADVIFPTAGLRAEQNEEKQYKQFIADIGNKVIRILVNKSAPLSQRQQEFRQIIRQHFDMPAVGKFVLGRYWRQASSQQQKEYLQLFEDAIVESYSQQFENYNNEKLQVESARPGSGGGMIITSTIIRPAGTPPLQVDWKVYATKKGLRILDVIVNGVSMSITYRTEYGNAYNANGGTIDGLLAAMKSKAVIPVTTPNDD
ncbi:MAG: ABC transporter substrate-binding protein [Caedimonas sp.]|jgi:phospholipid transport system substrate-binding protein|nr:ABC transporter substrate-binding protein [Caedimonas sp.]